MYVSKSPKEQSIAISRSAAVSEAYSTLKDPISRAKYVLAMQGVNLEQESVQDPQLLMQIMEEQEAIGGGGLSKEELQNKANHYAALMDTALRQADDLFKAHAGAALVPVKHLVVRAQYYAVLKKLANEKL